MKVLDFDIDGTVLVDDEDRVKPGLGDGRLEAAVRDAGIGRLVCVGNFVTVARLVMEVNGDYDALGVILNLCRGAFADHDWFRGSTHLVEGPEDRASHIDLRDDWWYVDDLAPDYCERGGRSEVFAREVGRRIFVPSPKGDGGDILEWLDQVVKVGGKRRV